MKILIKGGRVIDPRNGIDDKMDIYVRDGVICDIEDDLEFDSAEVEVIDEMCIRDSG